MNQKGIKILEEAGWTVECENPFELRHEDGSFATGQAANLVYDAVLDEYWKRN